MASSTDETTGPVLKLQRNEFSTVSSDDFLVDTAENDEMITVELPSGKEYAASDALSGVSTDDFLALRDAPWFDVEEFDIEGFVDKYATDGWLPRNIPPE